MGGKISYHQHVTKPSMFKPVESELKACLDLFEALLAMYALADEIGPNMEHWEFLSVSIF